MKTEKKNKKREKKEKKKRERERERKKMLMCAVLSRALSVIVFAMLLIRAPDFFWFDVRPIAWVARGASLAAATYVTLTARCGSCMCCASGGSNFHHYARHPFLLMVLFALLKASDEAREMPGVVCSGANGQSRPCVVLVTGANSGIGFATSQALYEQGHTVV